jgi:hypothetical protein
MMVAILHEGSAKKTADNELLRLLIRSLNLDESKVNFFGFGGKSNFFKVDFSSYKELLSEVKEENISRILFVVDADYEKDNMVYGGCQNTKQKLNDTISELKLENISDMYITCDPQTQDGYLESLILSSIPKEQKECIENFLNCSDFKSKENHKAILNQIYKNAYPQAPYNFEHQNFDGLKTKLKNLFKGTE